MFGFFLLLLSLACQVVAQFEWTGFSGAGIPNSSNCIRPQSGPKNPLTNVYSNDLRCGRPSTLKANATCTVAAGSVVVVHLNTPIPDPGVLNIYMAKAVGSTAATMDGAGSVWFKVYQKSAVVSPSPGLATWPVVGQQSFTFSIPSQLPAGEYLLRAEYIDLASASVPYGARFYVACVQLRVVGPGSATPGPLVSIPGAYTHTHPGLLIDVGLPMVSYTQPGPVVWP
ncbi:hypothetical protein FRC03_004241 [Tulasnella sp. 419]|nr:hypothetical protein FRC02_005512 [Tulasnella sp. 418]KAG8962434.1 hypothetical protein FRC03_004241 [Tulasnella sp. 419]